MSVILTELKLADQRMEHIARDLSEYRNTIRAIIAQLETTNMRATDIVEEKNGLEHKQ